MIDAGTEFDSLPVRDKLDILLKNESLDPRISLAVGALSNELREENRHPTYYEEVLVMLLENPNDYVVHPDMEKLYSNNNPTQSVNNLLHRLKIKFEEVCEEYDFVIQRETVPAYRLVVKPKATEPTSD